MIQEVPGAEAGMKAGDARKMHTGLGVPSFTWVRGALMAAMRSSIGRSTAFVATGCDMEGAMSARRI